MRFAIFLFLILFPSIQTWGQGSALFVVVSCSEGVMLDGKAVSPGLIADANSNQLIIPKKGYVGVITYEGFAFELLESIRVGDLINKIRRENRPKKILFNSPLAHPIQFEIISAPENRFANVVGDSILLALKDSAKVRPTYIIEFKNMFDNVLSIDTVFNNWKKYGVRELLSKEEAGLIQAKTGKRETQQYLLKNPAEILKSKLTFDLSRIPQNSPNEKEFRLAIYHLDHFYYDHLFLLYQLERSNYQPQNKIFSSYITQQKKKYHFELFDFHK
jgi:hypothetical protein